MSGEWACRTGLPQRHRVGARHLADVAAAGNREYVVYRERLCVPADVGLHRVAGTADEAGTAVIDKGIGAGCGEDEGGGRERLAGANQRGRDRRGLDRLAGAIDDGDRDRRKHRGARAAVEGIAGAGSESRRGGERKAYCGAASSESWTLRASVASRRLSFRSDQCRTRLEQRLPRRIPPAAMRVVDRVERHDHGFAARGIEREIEPEPGLLASVTDDGGCAHPVDEEGEPDGAVATVVSGVGRHISSSVECLSTAS